jgi:SAM-dependent MidA family methyltransferase
LYNSVFDYLCSILEFGAGSGILAAQILFELGRLGKLPKNYYILELSAELQQRQKDTINNRRISEHHHYNSLWLDNTMLNS